MRFLADENFPGAAVGALIAIGHDVAWVRTLQPGIGDRAVLSWAIRESRVLLTFDKDFGELARSSRLPQGCGIVLFRAPLKRPEEIGPQLARLLESRRDWAGHFSVIEAGRIRMRPLRQP
jgi:predicted nuclease of predicted toxin-antitoxin system